MENTPAEVPRPRMLEPLFATDAHAARRLRGAADGAAPGSVPALKRPRLDDDGAGPSAPPDSAPPLRQPLRERAGEGEGAAGCEDEMVNSYEARSRGVSPRSCVLRADSLEPQVANMVKAELMAEFVSRSKRLEALEKEARARERARRVFKRSRHRGGAGAGVARGGTRARARE